LFILQLDGNHELKFAFEAAERGWLDLDGFVHEQMGLLYGRKKVNSQRVSMASDTKAYCIGNYPTETPAHSNERYCLGHDEERKWFFSPTMTFLGSNLLRVPKADILKHVTFLDASYMEDPAGNNPFKLFPLLFGSEAYNEKWADHAEKTLKLGALLSSSPSETPRIFVLGADAKSMFKLVKTDLQCSYAHHPQCLMHGAGCFLPRPATKELATSGDAASDVTYGLLSAAISGLAFRNLNKAFNKRNQVGFIPSGRADGVERCLALVVEVKRRVLVGTANAKDLFEAEGDLAAQQFSFDSCSRGGEFLSTWVASCL
jgi:hypothetical protein